MDSILDKYASTFGINLNDDNNIYKPKRLTKFRIICQVLRGKKIVVFANTEDCNTFNEAMDRLKDRMKNFVTKKGDSLVMRALKIDWATVEENTLLSGKKTTMRPIKVVAMDPEELKNRLLSYEKENK